MNVVVSVFFIIFFFEILRRKRDIPTHFVFLTVVGAASPLGDYAYRFFASKPLIHSCEVIFHSFFYQWCFWSIIVFYHWLTTRQLKSSFRFYLPLLGLGIYAFFSIFSTTNIPFFYPLTQASVSYGLTKAGYLFLLIPLSLLWITKKWNRLSLYSIGLFGFSLLGALIVLLAITNVVIKNSLTEPFTNSERLSIIPTSHYYSSWNIVAYQQGKYHLDQYRLFKGHQNELQTQLEFEDLELMQNILFNPLIHCLYYHSFKNPLAQVDIQKEKLILEISELIPSKDLFEIEKLIIIQNKSGQIIDFRIHYRFLFWFTTNIKL